MSQTLVEPIPYAAVQKPASSAAVWTGRVLSVLPCLFLLMGGVMNVLKPPFVVEGTVKMGYSPAVILPIGVVLLTCTILYLIPQTAVLGAILLTGYLGGAVATHVRAGDPLGKGMIPFFFGVVLWLGLYLRDPRLRKLVPFRTKADVL